MANIFDKQDSQNRVERLKKRTPQTQPLWGKMTASQMVVHCQKPLDVALGKLLLSGGILGFLFGKIAKNSFIKTKDAAEIHQRQPNLKSQAHPISKREKQH